MAADAAERLLTGFVAVCAAVALACAAVPLAARLSAAPAAPAPAAAETAFAFPPEMVGGRADELEWDARDPEGFVRRVVAAGRPALIRGSPCARLWPALNGDRAFERGRWPYRGAGAPEATLASPEGYAFLLRGAKQGASRLFCPLRVTRDGRQLPSDGTRRDAYEMRDLTLREFLDEARAAPGPAGSGSYLYYSGAVGDELAASLRPSRFLEVHSVAENASVQAVWMAQDGVVANMHYDRSYNFVTQVSGGKSWTLFPPRDAARLLLYPALHPHYHSTAVDLLNPRADAAFPEFAGARGLEVEARAGDVLYVPPYWAHTVRSRNFSVTSSVVSPSAEERACSAVERVESLPLLRFPPAWPLARRGRAVLDLLREVAAQEGLASLAALPAAAVADSRYRVHLAPLARHTTPEMRREAVAGGCFAGAPAPGADEVRASAALLREALDGVRAAGPDGADVADLCLANLMERALAAALGPRNVATAVAFCVAR